MAVITITGTRNNEPVSYIGTDGKDGYVYFQDDLLRRILPGQEQDGWSYVQQLNEYMFSQSWSFVAGYKLTVANFNPGGITGGNGAIAPNADVEAAVKWMIDIAADNSHGYDQINRWGPDYDCSSLVIQGFENAGFGVKSAGATYTGNMRHVFVQQGFTWMPGAGNTASELIRGDILLDEDSHVEVYIGSGQMVGAHINEFGAVSGGQTGDQTGREISTRDWYNRPWDGVLRWNG